MRTLCGFAIALLFSTGLFAQNHPNQSGFVNPGPISRGIGSVVHPAGTSAMPGVQRTTGSVVNPAGGGAQIGIPGIPLAKPGQPGNGGQGRNGFRNNGTVTTFSYPVAYPVAYPVYVGSGYDQAPQQAPAQQPNVIVVYPPPPAYPAYPAGPPAPVQSNMVEVPQAPEQPASDAHAIHYLIALKDHSIYSAIAYWVDGDTLHYFSSGNTHSQVSVSMVDRDLTKRLNEDSGLEVKLPAAK